MPDPGAQDLEHADWVDRAARYRDLFGALTWQAIDPVLAALGPLAQVALLDVASGTGEFAGSAARRGARVHGIDFAAPMVAIAQDRYPQVAFRVGKAEDLPCAEASFDAVTCLFGMPHFHSPERALQEARRVLRSGGRLVMTTWRGPQDGGELFALVRQLLEEHLAQDPAAVPPPSMFRFADPDECRRCLVAAGFAVDEVQVVDLLWTCVSARAILELVDQGLGWVARALDAQPGVRERVARALDVAGEARRRGGKISFRFPALMVTATAVDAPGGTVPGLRTPSG